MMYYPKQLPYLLDKDFKENMEYVEYNLKELEDFSMCIWSMQSKKIVEKTIYNYILPDACIDIVIDFTNKTICFAGFSKDTICLELKRKIDYMGIRLKPSVFYTAFHIEADKIMDAPMPFSQIDNSNELEKIFEKQEISDRILIFKNYLFARIKNNDDKKYIDIVDDLYQNPKDQTVLEIANKFGYNPRHLFRIFKKYYGVSPKVLLNIVRLHLCLTLLLERNQSLQDIMSTCGFYDQSHFIKEIKKYTGFSPLELLEQYQV